MPTIILPIRGTASQYFATKAEALAYAASVRQHLGSRSSRYRIAILQDGAQYEVRISNW